MLVFIEVQRNAGVGIGIAREFDAGLLKSEHQRLNSRLVSNSQMAGLKAANSRHTDPRRLRELFTAPA